MATDHQTRLARAFCSAQDRNVPVLVRAGGWMRRAPSSRDAAEAVTCLEYGVRCTGWLCPLFAVPTLPPEALIEEAIEAEIARREHTVREGRAILERSLREARFRAQSEGTDAGSTRHGP